MQRKLIILGLLFTGTIALSPVTANGEVLAMMQLEARGSQDGIHSAMDIRLQLRPQGQTFPELASLFSNLRVDESHAGRTFVANFDTGPEFGAFAFALSVWNVSDLYYGACNQTPNATYSCHGNSQTAPGGVQGMVITSVSLTFTEITIVPESNATRTEFVATLTVEGYNPVPIQISTWGSVKARFSAE